MKKKNEKLNDSDFERILITMAATMTRPAPVETIDLTEQDDDINAHGQEVCAICCGHAITFAAELSCGHKFHRRCIKTWLQQKPSCPLCRANAALQRARPRHAHP
jgi:hypothetical protein